MLSDTELLRRYSADTDEGAFTEFVARHLDLVYGAALGPVGGVGHVAEEVCQLVFITVAQNAGSLKHHPALGGWLYVAARHQAISLLRAEKRRQAREQDSFSMQDASAANPPDEPTRLRAVLGEALEQLGDHDREAVILRYFEGRKFGEIGLISRVSEDAARMRVDRALEKLRSLLGRRGISSTASALVAALANEASAHAPPGLGAAVAGKALLSATAAGSPLPILTLMSLNKINVAALAGLAILAALSVRQLRMNAALADGLAEARASYQADLSALAKLRVGARDAHRSVAPPGATAESSTQEAGTPNRIPPSKAGAAAQAAGLKPRPAGINNRALSGDPQVRLDLLAYSETVNRNLYRPWFAALGFTEKQAEDMVDLMALAKDQTIGPATLSLRPDDESTDDVQLAMSQLLRQVLPDKSARAQFWADISTGEATELTSSLAGNLYDTNYPLTPEQGAQLTQIVANNSAQHNGPPPHWATLSTVNWTAALAQAQAVLSAPQLETLRQEAELVQSGAFIGPHNPGAFGR